MADPGDEQQNDEQQGDEAEGTEVDDPVVDQQAALIEAVESGEAEGSAASGA